ncbi:MAG: alpha-glucosidase C-terminal domain-containing protein, partial [Erysipelotrichaceae bacterium]|nr:alpha-glucosidase C-terminal domain-containing protein [Erysipelotrichaceae bacterium]
RVIAYSRQYNGRRLFVAGNFSAKTVEYQLPIWIATGKLLLNNYDELERNGLKVTLKPYQALVFAEK